MGPGRSQCTVDVVGHRPASQIASCDHQGATIEKSLTVKKSIALHLCMACRHFMHMLEMVECEVEDRIHSMPYVWYCHSTNT